MLHLHFPRAPFHRRIPEASPLSPEAIEALKSMSKEQIARVLFKSQKTLVGGNCVSEGTTINSSRTKPRLGPSKLWVHQNFGRGM